VQYDWHVSQPLPASQASKKFLAIPVMADMCIPPYSCEANILKPAA
jgi:hypothetical protein